MRIYNPTEESVFTYPTRNSLSALQYLGVEVFGCDTNSPKISLPIFGVKVEAGVPSPADDYIEKSLDLNELLIQKPAASFFDSLSKEVQTIPITTKMLTGTITGTKWPCKA